MNKLIYIVEDDESIRELISYTLISAGFEAISFVNAKKFYKALEKQKPHIILLDIMLSHSSDESGIQIVKKIKQNENTKYIPVIFITAKSNEVDKAFGLDIGADDYITKPFGVLELIARVKAVLRRYESSTRDDLPKESIFTYKDITIDLKSKQVFKDNEEIKLTFKEYELLLYFYKNKGIVISRDQLLEKIWGEEFFGDKRTVDVHIRTLRQKLQDNADNPLYLSTIRGYGYKLIKE